MAKRIFAVLIAAAALSACASPLAQAETPQQALVAATQKMSALQSAKVDLNGTVTMHLPPQLAQLLNQEGTKAQGFDLSNLVVTLKGTGEAQFPDRLHAQISTQLGGLTVTTEEVVAAGKAYVKNPVTGRWSLAQSTGGLSNELNQPDPLSAAQLLDTAKSVTDLGDTTLAGVAVHHYRLTPDRSKLIAKLQSLPALKNNAQAQQAFTQILNGGTMTLEVWFGKSDHLVRRLVSDATLTFDLGQLMQALGTGRGTQGTPLPHTTVAPGAASQVVAHLQIDYHDFNTPVTVTVPQVG
ncbi:MAG TPA: hypothetical protein VET65_06000 [Candidatus Limnocylindrales bacterium]|nr:hypothetical protein [Candidatus Limnocylindrales bacterium]